MNKFIVGGYLVLFLGVSWSSAQELEIPKADQYQPGIQLETIAFGSCIHQEREAPILGTILAASPDVFLFLGDNIYMNTESIDELKKAYAVQKRKPLLQELLKTTDVHAVWDDNDYGARDGGKEYRMKEQSKSLFLNFFEVPDADPRRYRDGIYYSAIYGKEERSIQLLFLDTRWFRDRLTRATTQVPGAGPYMPSTSPEATMLGQKQWDWLEEQLRVPASLRIVVSSIQVIPFRHGFESWGTMPHEQERLLTLLANDQVPVVLLSGDRHHGDISSRTFAGKTFVELTSSSLNLPRAAGAEANEYRISGEYRGANFGMLRIDWESKALHLEILDEKGVVVLEHQQSF